MRVIGSCRRGRVPCEAGIDAAEASLCDRTGCRKLSGAVYRVDRRPA